MPCGINLTASRKKTGGVKMKGFRAISFAPFDIANKIISLNNQVSDLPVGLTQIYRFEVKNSANNFIESFTKDPATMSGENKGVATFSLMYCDREKNVADAKALENGSWVVFFETNDNKVFVVGIHNGADILTVVESTDAQGFLFTLDTAEPDKACTLVGVALTEYNSSIVAYA